LIQKTQKRLEKSKESLKVRISFVKLIKHTAEKLVLSPKRSQDWFRRCTGVVRRMRMTNSKMTTWEQTKGFFQRFHQDESGVAMTEYIIVFSLVSLGATISLIGCAVYVKAYRDFLVWWLAHPAV